MERTQERKVETALVTGATSGIGRELARLLAQSGKNVILVGRNQERLAKIAADLKANYSVSATSIAKDLSAQFAADDIFSELRRSNISIDILVNNAGFNEYGAFHETNWENELRMMQVHMVSLTRLTKLFLPEMISRKNGKILNVGSTGSFGPGPLNAVYCATKAYVLSFSEAISEELRGTGVTVTTLCPGATDTEFARRANMTDVKLFQGNLMRPEHVAEIGHQAMMGGKRTVVAGSTNKLTVFALRLLPRTLVTSMIKNMLGKN